MLIKQSSSNKVVPFFLVDSTDHISPKTGLVPTVTISKNGAAFGTPAGAVTEIGSGWYKIAASATDSNTIGALLVHATATGADPFDVIHEVIEATLAKGTDITGFNDLSAANVQTELTTYGALKPTTAGRTLDVTATGEAGVDFDNTVGTLVKGTDITGFNDIAAGTAMTLTSAYDPAKTAAQVGSAMTLTAAYDAAKTAAAPGAAMTLTSGERTSIGVAVRDTNNSAPAGGSLGADIKSGVAGDPWTVVLPGSYGANTAGSLIGNNLDAQVSTRLPASSYTAPPTANQNAVATRDINNQTPAANSLGAAINTGAAGGDPWATVIPGAYGAGTAGKILGDNINATISSRLAAAGYTAPPTTANIAVAVRDVSNATPAAGSLGEDVKTGGADVWAKALPGSYTAGSAGNILGNRLDVAVSTRLDGSVYAIPPSASTIAAATRDVNNQTPAANSLGAAINAAASAGDPWGTALPGAYGAGTAGKIIGDRIDATISSRLAAASYVVPPTKEVIAIATRDVDNSSPVSGSMGDKINAAASAGDPWSTVLPGSYGAGSAGKLMSDNLDAKVSTRLPTASYMAAPDTGQIATAVRDVNNLTPAPNSLGAAVNSAASAGDPWSTTLPGSYGTGTAGNIIGNQIDVAVSSRLAANNYVVPPTTLAIAQATRDVDNQTPATNSLGAAINRAASAGDPWSAQLPNPAYGTGTAGKLIGDNLNATITSRLAASAYVIPPNVSQIAVANRDVSNASPAPGSLGEAVNSAASAGDPWATLLPGIYAAGTAGALIGNNVDAKISTRLPTSGYVQAPSAQVVAQSVRDIDNTTPATNSLGAAINVSALAGDPWIKVLPGSYGAGTAGKLVGDNLDVKVSTRSTYAGLDTPGTTTLLTRVPSALAINSGKVDVNDKTNFSLTPEYDKAKNAAQTGDPMSLTSAERTTLSASIWQYLTSFMTTIGTVGRLIVDNLNAPVASRLATSSYTAPDNTGISQIKAKTDALPSDPAGVSNIPAPAVVAVAVRDVSNASPVVGSLGADVKLGAQTLADPWASNLPGSYPAGTAGNLVGANLDVKVGSRLAASAITLNGGEVTVGTNNDKSGYSLVDGQASAIADEVLKRDWQLVSGEATYCVLNALRFLRDAWEVQPDGTLVVYKENGQIAWTRSVKADPDALPITGVS